MRMKIMKRVVGGGLPVAGNSPLSICKLPSIRRGVRINK
jgi:hypothetical protein